MFTVISRDKETKARVGEITTMHGTVETPVFMPVATKGTVKTLSPEELKGLGRGGNNRQCTPPLPQTRA